MPPDSTNPIACSAPYGTQSIVIDLIDPSAPNSENSSQITRINDVQVREGKTIVLPSGATVQLDFNRVVTYLANENQIRLENGRTLLDTFLYTLTDDDGRESVAEAVVMISTEVPVVVADDNFVSTPVNTPVSFTVVSTEQDVEHDFLNVQLLNQPSSGKAMVQTDNSICFIPDPKFVGTVTLHYLIEDGAGEFCDATTTIDVG